MTVVGWMIGGKLRPEGIDAAEQRRAEGFHGVGVNAREELLLTPPPFGGRGRLDQCVFGSADAKRAGHASCRIERLHVVGDHGPDLLIVWEKRPGAGVHEHQRTDEIGPGQDHTQRDPTAHRMAEQVDRPLGHLFNEADQVGGQLIDGVAGDVMGLGREAVAALIQRDDTPRLGQSLDLQREIMGGPGEAVAEHQGRRPTRRPTGPSATRRR